jgi:DNA-binding Lrp family transcriptional regulator
MEWVRLYTDILDDEKISKISDFSYKIFTFLLLLCREREAEGEINMTVSDIAWRFRLPENKVKRAVDELLTIGIISSISPITITKWESRQYKSDNVSERVKRFRQKNETLHETLQNKKCNVIETETETETEQKQNINTFLRDSKEFTLAYILFDQILSRNPKFKKPNLQSWSKDIDLMIRVDSRSPDDIRKVILWCQGDPFWQNNILSAAKLREKFDQLLMKMGGNNGTGNGSGFDRSKQSIITKTGNAQSDGTPWPADREY